MWDLCSDRPVGSPLWLLVLIEGLPDNGLLAASFQGDREFRGWGVDRHMAADFWDMKAIELHGGSKKGKPVKYPRPGQKKATGTTLAGLMPRRRKPKESG